MSTQAIAAIAAEPPVVLDDLVATQPVAPMSFDNVLSTLETLNTQLVNGQNATASLAAGAPENLHHTVIGMEQTRLSFELMLAVRNKLLDGYQELMRMQV